MTTIMANKSGHSNSDVAQAIADSMGDLTGLFTMHVGEVTDWHGDSFIGVVDVAMEGVEGALPHNVVVLID